MPGRNSEKRKQRIVNIIEFVLALLISVALQILAMMYAKQYEAVPPMIFGIFYGNKFMKKLTQRIDKSIMDKYYP